MFTKSWYFVKSRFVKSRFVKSRFVKSRLACICIEVYYNWISRCPFFGTGYWASNTNFSKVIFGLGIFSWIFLWLDCLIFLVPFFRVTKERKIFFFTIINWFPVSTLMSKWIKHSCTQYTINENNKFNFSDFIGDKRKNMYVHQFLGYQEC